MCPAHHNNLFTYAPHALHMKLISCYHNNKISNPYCTEEAYGHQLKIFISRYFHCVGTERDTHIIFH